MKKIEWENEVVSALLSEQRKTRISGWFFKSFAALYIIAITIAVYAMLHTSTTPSTSGGVKHAAIINLSGIIVDRSPASADNVIRALRNAMYDPDTAGIIIRCNSPGGSPVQSDYIYREIRRLRSSNPGTPIHTVVTDVCASGGYYVAAATDKIFVNPNSILGSIGVITEGFGYAEIMEKLGVERRVFTSGENKNMLDPYEPLNASDIKHSKKIMSEIHREFINSVVRGRGQKLKLHHPDIFSGLYWTGRSSIKLGLADGIGDIYTVSKNYFGVNSVVDFTTRESQMNKIIRQLSTEIKIMFKELSSYVVSI